MIVLIEVKSNDYIFLILFFHQQKGTKGDNVQITVKVEFGEKVLGESPKVECVPDTPADIDYTATLNCSFEDPLVLDEISYKPVVCKWLLKRKNFLFHY